MKVLLSLGMVIKLGVGTVLSERYGSSSRFIPTAGICTERLPRRQVFCVLGDS